MISTIKQLVLLRSSSQLLYVLHQPATRIDFQSKEFSIMSPAAVWNSLSPVTKSSATVTTFKEHLKTWLFSAALRLSLTLTSATGASDSNSWHTGAAYKCYWHWHWYVFIWFLFFLSLSSHCLLSVFLTNNRTYWYRSSRWYGTIVQSTKNVLAPL